MPTKHIRKAGKGTIWRDKQTKDLHVVLDNSYGFVTYANTSNEAKKFWLKTVDFKAKFERV